MSRPYCTLFDSSEYLIQGYEGKMMEYHMIHMIPYDIEAIHNLIIKFYTNLGIIYSVPIHRHFSKLIKKNIC